MSKLGTLSCLGSSYNIAKPNCPFNPGLETSGIFAPTGFQFKPSDFDSENAFRAALVAASNADDAADRLQIVGPYEDWADSSEAAADQTFGSGLKRRVREASMQRDLTIPEDKYYHERVKKALHNKQGRFDYFFVFDQQDGTWIVMGQNALTPVAPPAVPQATMSGFDLNVLNISNYQLPTGSTVGLFTLQRGFTSPIAVDTDFTIMQVDFDPLKVMKGLQDVELFATSVVTDTIHVRGFIEGSGDIKALYGNALAEDTAWVITNEDTTSPNNGNIISIAATPPVTAAGDGYDITLEPALTDPDNPGSGKRVGIRLADPSDLLTLTIPVTGITSGVTYVTLF